MILFTADWHLKLGQKNVPKNWAIARYNEFFKQVNKITSECTLHIIGGDIFDRVPTLEELNLFFKFVTSANVDTLIYDGNHEASTKNKTFFTHLKDAVSTINPLVRIIDEPTTEMRFSILPYCYLHRKDYIEKLPTDRPLFTHVRGEIPPHVKPEVDLARFDPFPIVFAGDLHAHSNCQRNIVYPGSPMTTSFHRSEVKTGYIIIDELDWFWEWREFNLPQLIRNTVQDPKDMISTDYHHTIYELEGNIQDLADTENSELLDKKVIKRSSETTLILDPEMTLEQELYEYLKYILDLPEKKIEELMRTFHDYT